jgi:hypothetical protein
MSTIITIDGTDLTRVKSPVLPFAPFEYNREYHDALNNILRQYFNTIDSLIGQLMATSNGTFGVYGAGTGADAFGRLRVSNPYTLFDSQNRFAKDNQFSESTANGASITYNGDEATVLLSADTTSGSQAVRQSLRCMPYQPGKGLLVMCTFVMGSAQSNLRQRVGYFNTANGVFFQQSGTTKSFVLRTSTSGSPSDARIVNQADWNGDKLDGTGASELTLDLSKAQILWMDFEWLGVGSVRCGFIINGQYIVCHTFNNANDQTKVYMTTAILPVRYEIEATGALSTGATLKQICSTVISEGGYGQVVAANTARRTTVRASISTTPVPLISIRLKTGRTGAVVLPQTVNVMPTTAGNYEVVLARLDDASSLTSASWVTSDFENVEYDVSATAVTIAASQVVDQFFITATNQSAGASAEPVGYNFDTQIGASLAGVSQVYVVAVRVLSGTGDAVGALTFYDLTQ